MIDGGAATMTAEREQAMQGPQRVAPGSGRALELDSISVRFGGIKALSNVSLTVETGERWAVIGPNGAGKSTLFAVISGHLRPTSGTVSLFGTRCTHWSQRRRAHFGLGRTFQINNVFPALTVEENLVVAAQATGRQRFRFWRPVRLVGDLEQRVEDALTRSGLHARRHHVASELSHGEARQLEIALALACRARILLLDEPAAGLAAQERALIAELVDGLPRTMTLILIEHDMNLALGLVDRVMCLNNGVPVESGTPQQIRESEAVQNFYLGTA
jgi:branched-chain amino acid transport system ATP-binding protein